MTKKYYISLAILGLLTAGCQQRVFGVDEAVWSTLNAKEREQVIEGYNKRKEKELDNERHRQEMEAQTAPIYAAAGVVSSIMGSANHKDSSLCIQSISPSTHTLTIGDDQFEVSIFSKMSHAWVKGQKVSLSKNENDVFHPVKIKNLDNGETVIAKKRL